VNIHSHKAQAINKLTIKVQILISTPLVVGSLLTGLSLGTSHSAVAKIQNFVS